MSECLTTKQPCITATGTTPKQLVNTVTASSTTSAGVRHLIQLSATPTKLWFLPMNWRSETRLSSTRSAFCGTIATSEFNAPAGTKSVVVKGFSGDSKTCSSSTAHSPSSPESPELPEIKYPTLLGPIPEISFVDNLVFTFGSLRDSGDGDEIRNNGRNDTGTLTGSPRSCSIRSTGRLSFSLRGCFLLLTRAASATVGHYVRGT